MNEWTNPAQRLHVLLLSVLPGRQDEQMHQVWATVFDVEDPSEIKVSRYLVGMADCLTDIRRLLASRPDVRLEPYTKCFAHIENVIAPGALRQTRQQIISPHLQPEVLTRLEFCAEELRRFVVEKPLSDEDLTRIRTEVDALEKLVESSTIDSRLKLALLEDLDRMRVAIRLYRVQGPMALANVQRSLVGAAEVHATSIENASAEDKAILARIGKFLEQLDKVVSKATTIYTAIAKPTRFLLSLMSDSRENQSDESPSDEAFQETHSK